MKKKNKKSEQVKTVPTGENGKFPVQRIKNTFIRQEGGLRAGWFLLWALLVFRGVSYGVRIGMNAAFAALFSAWNVTSANIHLAPHWAQMVYSWHGSIITVIVCLVSLLSAVLLRVQWMGKVRIVAGRLKDSLTAAAAGAGIAVVSAALFLIMDSMRLELPLSEPDLSWSLIPMLTVTLFTTLSEEMLTKTVVFDGISGRSRTIWAYIMSALTFFLFNGGYAGTVISGINVFLMGMVCCVLYARYGLWSSVLFRGIWSYVSVFVIGFGATSAARSVYTIYRVSDAWLTGGDGGLIYGVWMTVVLLGMTAWMCRRSIVLIPGKLTGLFVKKKA